MEEKENNISSTDIEYKIILLGDSDSGKQIFLKKITNNTYKEKNVSTIGIDRRTFKVKCDLEENDGKISTKTVEISLIDTAGQERYKALTKTYFKVNDASIIFYDITSKKSLNDIQYWIESINNYSKIYNNDYPVFLLGSKLHLVESGEKEREVKEDEAIELCEENKIEWGGEYKDIDSTEILQNKFIDFVKIIYKKIGVKKVALLGLVFLMTGHLSMMFFTRESSVIFLAASQFIRYVGFGLLFIPISTWALTMVPDNSEDGSTVYNTSREIAGSIGSSILVVLTSFLVGFI